MVSNELSRIIIAKGELFFREIIKLSGKEFCGNFYDYNEKFYYIVTTIPEIIEEQEVVKLVKDHSIIITDAEMYILTLAMQGQMIIKELAQAQLN